MLIMYQYLSFDVKWRQTCGSLVTCPRHCWQNRRIFILIAPCFVFVRCTMRECHIKCAACWAYGSNSRGPKVGAAMRAKVHFRLRKKTTLPPLYLWELVALGRKLLLLDLKSSKNVEWHRVQPSAGSPLDSAKHVKYHVYLDETATIRLQHSWINK